MDMAKIKYDVLSPLKHNGEKYKVGAVITDLDDKTSIALMQANIIGLRNQSAEAESPKDDDKSESGKTAPEGGDLSNGNNTLKQLLTDLPDEGKNADGAANLNWLTAQLGRAVKRDEVDAIIATNSSDNKTGGDE